MFLIAHNGARVWGGAEIATTRLLAGLAGRGHRVLLFCGDEEVAERAAALGVPTRPMHLGGDVALHDALSFARELRHLRPDALLVGTFRKLWLASLAARLARVPRVVARVGLETDTPRSWKYRMVLRRGWVDTVVVNAERIRAPFLALPGWSAERVITIHNGATAPERMRASGALRRELGIAADAPVVGAVARLADQKRLDRLLAAVAALDETVHCILAGDGPERAALQARAGELGIAERVHFLGHRDDVADVLDSLDLYVVSSGREGLSNAMLEALAAGVPVLSTPVSGADDALAPLADGRAPGVVCSFEEQFIAEGIRRLLADRAALGAMGEAARDRWQERFGVETMLDRWEQVLGARSRD